MGLELRPELHLPRRDVRVGRGPLRNMFDHDLLGHGPLAKQDRHLCQSCVGGHTAPTVPDAVPGLQGRVGRVWKRDVVACDVSVETSGECSFPANAGAGEGRVNHCPHSQREKVDSVRSVRHLRLCWSHCRRLLGSLTPL